MGMDMKDLAENSHVSRSTLRSWMNGNTISPRNMTLCAVAGALGYDYRLSANAASQFWLWCGRRQKYAPASR